MNEEEAVLSMKRLFFFKKIYFGPVRLFGRSADLFGGVPLQVRLSLLAFFSGKKTAKSAQTNSLF
ncbi:MAG: hypothetical protein ACYC01_00870 [Lutibacter sp.]